LTSGSTSSCTVSANTKHRDDNHLLGLDSVLPAWQESILMGGAECKAILRQQWEIYGRLIHHAEERYSMASMTAHDYSQVSLGREASN
jgi:hypothetical protein